MSFGAWMIRNEQNRTETERVCFCSMENVLHCFRQSTFSHCLDIGFELNIWAMRNPLHISRSINFYTRSAIKSFWLLLQFHRTKIAFNRDIAHWQIGFTIKNNLNVLCELRDRLWCFDDAYKMGMKTDTESCNLMASRI